MNGEWCEESLLDGIVYQHVITKGGECYTMKLGTFTEFSPNGYIAKITNIPPYNLIEADDGTFVNFDCVSKLWFTSQEVH